MKVFRLAVCLRQSAVASPSGLPCCYKTCSRFNWNMRDTRRYPAAPTATTTPRVVPRCGQRLPKEFMDAVVSIRRPLQPRQPPHRISPGRPPQEVRAPLSYACGQQERRRIWRFGISQHGPAGVSMNATVVTGSRR